MSPVGALEPALHLDVEQSRRVSSEGSRGMVGEAGEPCRPGRQCVAWSQTLGPASFASAVRLALHKGLLWDSRGSRPSSRLSGGGSKPVRSAALSWVRLAQPLPRAPSLMPGLRAANAFRISLLLSQGDGPGFCAHPLLRDFSLSPQPPPPCPVVGILRLFPSSQH